MKNPAVWLVLLLDACALLCLFLLMILLADSGMSPLALILRF
jgi:hypothetical protein